MFRELKIPEERFWPEGFTTDYVTYFPDQPLLFEPRKTWKVWKWFTRVDLRPAAWWHDVQYYLGRVVSPWGDLEALSKKKPYPACQRNELIRWHIDNHFRVNCIQMGVHPDTARALRAGVQMGGASHYYWREA